MGHIRLGRLPKKGKWKQVIGCLADSETKASDVAQASLSAAENVLQSIEGDPGVTYCLWILTQITAAARSESFIEGLSRLGINATGRETPSELLAKIANIVSSKLQKATPNTIFTDIAQLSMREVLTDLVGRHVPTLFGATFEDTRQAYRRFSTQKQFGLLARHYFTNFLRRVLSFVLDKELSNHIGPNRRFTNISEANRFIEALDAFCYQTSHIVEDFSGGWYSKKLWEGGINEQDARQFLHVAFNKLIADLRLSGGEGSEVLHPM